MRLILIGLTLLSGARSMTAAEPAVDGTIDIGSRLELFVDRLLIDRMDGVEFRLQEPQKLPRAKSMFKGHYATVIKDGDLYRMFYRGAAGDVPQAQVVCLAESGDGKTWIKPKLGLFEVNGTRENNVVHANDPRNNENTTAYAVFLDTRPGVPKDERYKATATAGPLTGRSSRYRRRSPCVHRRESFLRTTLERIKPRLCVLGK